jgi:SAM-dependent methyltransferase
MVSHRAPEDILMDAEPRGAFHLRGFRVCCPADHAALEEQDGALACPACGTRYPVIGGVPVLIRDETSVFAIGDYAAPESYEGASYGRTADRANGLRRLWRRVARRLKDWPSSIARPGPDDVIAYVRQIRPAPRVLVVGSGGLRLGAPGDRVLNTDVAFGPAVDAIADAHDLPFPDGSFDLVIAAAVLEHVADPQRCEAEMRRVLAPGGHVFADTPFLQPVHMGAYDFTRFTPIGHRRLFRHYDEIAAGISNGVGSALAAQSGVALQSLSRARAWRRIANAMGTVLTPPLRMMDALFRHGGDGAGGCWFFGRLRDGPPVSDRSLVQGYRDSFGMGPRSLPAPPSAARDPAAP